VPICESMSPASEHRLQSGWRVGGAQFFTFTRISRLVSVAIQQCGIKVLYRPLPVVALAPGPVVGIERLADETFQVGRMSSCAGALVLAPG